MRGVGEAFKCIQCPLLHPAKACCLAASVVTSRGPENKKMPLRTLMSSRITNHHLLVVLLASEERDRKKGEEVEKEKTRDRTLLATLYSIRWGRLRR
jgi:hypothetical protein